MLCFSSFIYAHIFRKRTRLNKSMHHGLHVQSCFYSCLPQPVRMHLQKNLARRVMTENMGAKMAEKEIFFFLYTFWSGVYTCIPSVETDYDVLNGCDSDRRILCFFFFNFPDYMPTSSQFVAVIYFLVSSTTLKKNSFLVPWLLWQTLHPDSISHKWDGLN